MSTTRPRRPGCPTILVCDRVVPRTAVGKVDVLGLFDALVVAAVPVELSLTVPFTPTDGQGGYALELSLKRTRPRRRSGRQPAASPCGRGSSTTRASFRPPTRAR
jgi:hypothetical protein